MNFPRVAILQGIFGRDSLDASARARRWTAAVATYPELAEDVIELGGILQLPFALAPDPMNPGQPVDPARLAFEAGQRDMAVKILALMGVTPNELNQLMEAYDV